MKLQYIITERLYDSYIDLLYYEYNSLSEDENPSIALINDLLTRIWITKTYFSPKTETVYKDLLVSLAKESHIIDKEVIGIGCNDFFKFYFVGIDDYKKLSKKEVEFKLFFWIMRLKSETVYSSDYKQIVSYTDFLKNISISNKKIVPRMVMKREGQGYKLKMYDIDSFISKITKQMNNPKTHI